MKLCLTLMLAALIFFIIGMLVGCSNTVEGTTSHSQPIAIKIPSRFYVKTAEYIVIDGSAPNISIYVIEDTTPAQNDFIVVDTGHGATMQSISRTPVENFQRR